METSPDRLLSPRRLVVLVTAVLWITFACGMPLQNAREARRQAHLQITQVVADGKPDAATVIAAFDRSIQDVMAAATLPCLFLAVCIVFLINQMLKLKRRYQSLERDFLAHQSRFAALTDQPLD